MDTHLTGEGDDSRSRLLSVLRGCPWGRDGFRGGLKVTDVAEDFLWSTEGRLLSLEDCRELSRWSSSEMDASVVVLISVDADANCRGASLTFASSLTRRLAEK